MPDATPSQTASPSRGTPTPADSAGRIREGRAAAALPLLAGLFLGLFLAADALRNAAVGVRHGGVGLETGADASVDELRARARWAPDLAGLHAALGRRAFEAGDYEAARAAYERAAERHPLHAPYRRHLALCLHKLGRPDEADRSMAAAARLARNNAHLQFQAGTYFLLLRAFPPAGGPLVVDEPMLRRRREMLERAVDAFRRAAWLDLSYLDRAVGYLEACLPGGGDIEAVVPETPEALERFAGYLLRRKDYAGAVRVLSRLLRGPWPVRNRWRLDAARASLGAGDEDRAEALVLEAATAGDLSADDVAFVARFYLAQKKPFQGIQALNAVRGHVRSDRTRIYTQIGKLWWAMGRVQSASLLFEKSAVESHDPEAYYHLALISEQAGDPFGAERFYRQSIRADRENPAYRYRLGLLFFREGRVSEAITEIEEAIRLAPGVRRYRDKLMEIMQKWNSE